MDHRITLTIPEAVRASGLSRSSIYVAMQQGQLSALKAGRRTLIRVVDLENYLASLPSFQKEG